MDTFPSKDPTHIFAQIRESMSRYPEYIPLIPYVSTLSNPNPPPLELVISSEDINIKYPSSEYVDLDLYTQTMKIKNGYSQFSQKQSVFYSRRTSANPYEKLDNSIFMNRAGIKMANIDAVFHLMENIGGMMEPQILDDTYRFVSIAEGPGAFIQYIQYRSPYGYGHGITLEEGVKHSFKWNTRQLNMMRLDLEYPGKVKGDIIKEWKQFTSHVLTKSGRVGLVTADGGVDLEGEWNEDVIPDIVGSHLQLLEDNQETLTSPLLVAECLIALVVCDRMFDRGPDSGGIKSGGNFVLKVFNTTTRVSAETIYVLTRCFKQVYCFKPVSSRPANSERYVVCSDMFTDEVVIPWVEILTKVIDNYNITRKLGSFLPDTYMEKEFVDWLKLNNDESMRFQIHAGKMILDNETAQGVDLSMCNTLWNIPQNKTINVVKEEPSDNANIPFSQTRQTRQTRQTPKTPPRYSVHTPKTPPRANVQTPYIPPSPHSVPIVSVEIKQQPVKLKMVGRGMGRGRR